MRRALGFVNFVYELAYALAYALEESVDGKASRFAKGREALEIGSHDAR
jgi:hypothetical protein